MRNILFIIIAFWTSFCGTSLYVYGRTKVVVSQSDDFVKVFSAQNTNYIIKEDINLSGKKVVVGAGSVLVFEGGSLSNGTIVGNNTKVKAGNYEIFKRGYTRYRAYIMPGASDRFPPSMIKEYRKCIVIEGTWGNRECGSNWTGLLNEIDEDVMLAVRNYVTLHPDGSKIKLPTINALGYESTKIPGNREIDFCNTTISYPNELSVWEDSSIVLPKGAVPCAMESGYGLIVIKSKTTIANLTLDGKSSYRQNEKLRLGVSNLVCVDNSHDVILKNLNILNVLGPAVVVHPKSKDITFRNCNFNNIGEHVVYSHQYLGFCHFEGCNFDTWDSERLSVFRNGFNYVYKHTPLRNAGDVTYAQLYNFDLCFSNCTFNNPRRVNSQGRTLGGFLTGDFPVIVKLEGCDFLGVSPKFNPGGGADILEKSGKIYKMIIKNCDGAPCVYPSKSNFNIISEYYNCINIPFRTVFSKRYENCELYLDIYEDDIENVSPSFENEFFEPLLIKNCEFVDRGTEVLVHHPVNHRPVSFYNCRFTCNIKRADAPEIISIKSNNLFKVEYKSCEFNLPGYRLVGGNKVIDFISVQRCRFIDIHQKYILMRPNVIKEKANVFSSKKMSIDY